jgi:single-stranded DNA-binding protein
MRNEITVVGASLEDTRIALTTRHGEAMILSHFYFDFWSATDADGEYTFVKTDALHVLFYGKNAVDVKPGMALRVIGEIEQDIWMTREGDKQYRIQNFVAHKVEVVDDV